MALRTIFIILSFTIPTTLFADMFDLNLNNESLRMQYGMDYGAAQFVLGGMYKKNDNDDSDAIGHLGLEVSGEEAIGRRSSLEGGLGIRAYGASVSDFDVLALGIGGHVQFFPNRTRFGFGVEGFYAPEVVTGLDSDRFWEVNARAEFRLLENAGIYLGYRLMKTRLEDSQRTITVDDAGHIGIRMRF